METKPQQSRNDSASTLRTSSMASMSSSHRSSISSGSSRKRVRFGHHSANLVVPPVSSEPLTPTEKRATWYTSKELESKHKADVDGYITYLLSRSKRHSYSFPSAWKSHHHHDDDNNRRVSAPAHPNSGPSCSSSSWRGLEHHKSDGSTAKRTQAVKHMVHSIVMHHHELTTQGQPLLNEDLRKYYQKKNRHDRIRAEQLGLQDAKDALGKIAVVKDLLTHEHTTLNSPQRQFRKVSMLAKMSVSGVVGSISVASF